MSKIPLILSLALQTSLFAVNPIYQHGWTDYRFKLVVTGMLDADDRSFPANYINAICVTHYTATHYTYDHALDLKNTESIIKVLKADGIFSKCSNSELTVQ